MRQVPNGSARVSHAAGGDDTYAGFAAGAIVLTLDGALPVEHLTPGDRVITRDVGMDILRDIRVARINCEVVEVMGGSLGHTCPDRDTVIPADQPVLVRDWRAPAMFGADQALVPARALADGEFIRRAGTRDLLLYRLDFDAPHILYVDGLELACATHRETRRAA
jgi:hypothetical protein